MLLHGLFCLRPTESLYFFPFREFTAPRHPPHSHSAVAGWTPPHRHHPLHTHRHVCVFQTVSFLFKTRIQPEAFYLIWSLILFACNVVISTCVLLPDNPINKHRDLQLLFPLIAANVNPFIWRHGDCVSLGCGQAAPVSWHEMLANEKPQKGPSGTPAKTVNGPGEPCILSV